MQILPLKFIHDDDKKTVGSNLFNLAKLKHHGLPVIESVIVLPPTDLINNIVKKYSRHNLIISEQKNNLRLDVLSLKIPESLLDIDVEYLAKKNNRIAINIERLWLNLLEKWCLELFSKIDRGEKNFFTFTPQQVIFSSNFTSLGQGFFDDIRKHVVIHINRGELDFQKSQEIEQLVLLGNKKLVLPQVYYWVVEEGNIKIIKLAPFTQNLPKKIDKENALIEGTVKTPKIHEAKNTATKILLDYSGEVLNSLTTDGIFLRVKKPDIEIVNQMITKILNLEKTPNIIFFPDFDSPQSIVNFAQVFLFYRNKRKLEAQIVLPQTFSKDEILSLKREFAGLGIYSKGSLKIWKQFRTVLDFINLEEYLEAGFDGAVLDLDEIAKIVTGVEGEVILSQTKLDWIVAIEKFLKETGFQDLIKTQKPVLIFGQLARNEEILNYLIKSGVWGLAFEKNIIESMREHVSFLEKQLVKKLGYTEIKH